MHSESTPWGKPKLSTEDDSHDLEDNEIARAVITLDFEQLAQLLTGALEPGDATVGSETRYSVTRHEIRRRSPHLYLRSYLVREGEPERVLVHQIDWVEAW